jgi:hypothetical protein
VLRIRAVFPGSRILIFTHPGSRIPKQQQKRGVKKNLLSYLFCRHKFYKIENYLIFEMLKKNIWANFEFSKNYRTFTQKYGFGIRNPGVKKAPDPGSESATLK